jgi:hypothetical protein
MNYATIRSQLRPGSKRSDLIGLALGTVALFFWLVLVSSALAGPPNHQRTEALDIGGLNHACGAAVDSKGDIYLSSAGESKIKVFGPAHDELGSISNPNEPCGLAVDSKGTLYVSEQATGKVLKYVPNSYPFSGAPSYGAAVPVDTSGTARGIAVDTYDDRLYVAEGDHVAVYKADGSFEVNLGEGEINDATGVAAYTYVHSMTKSEGKIFEEHGTRQLFVADSAGAEPDRVEIFTGSVEVDNQAATRTFGPMNLRREISGPPGGPAFDFGPAGAYLTVDPGNGNSEQKCTSVAEQACTAGHLLVYNAAQDAVDEFEANGQFLDSFSDPAIADAEPTAMAIDRSGGAGDGTIFITAGAGPGAKAIAFAPLPAPSRPPLPEPLSHVLASAKAVAVDSHGDVYVAAGSLIHVFDPSGKEIKVGPKGEGIEDPNNAFDLSVDSAGNVYVLDLRNEFENEAVVTYYTPAAYPPTDGATYARLEPPLATAADFTPARNAEALAVNPANDHLFVTNGEQVYEYDSAAIGSVLLNDHFGEGLGLGVGIQSLGVDGATGNLYFGSKAKPVIEVNPAGTEILAKVGGSGGPKGSLGANPFLSVDQSNGHVLEFDPEQIAAREYDASGAFVAEFGQFTFLANRYRIAIDSSCALHNPPLDETTTPTCHQFDPANGNVYIAYDDTAPKSFDLTAFGPLAYGEAPQATTGTASDFGAGTATLNGTVDPRGFDVSACKFQYLTDAQYQGDGGTFTGAQEAPCVPAPAGIGKGSGAVPVHADVSGLDPEGRYDFRLVAANKYGESRGEAMLFGLPVITVKLAVPVFYTEATVRATIDPSGLDTRYRFEYGSAAGEYDQSTPVGELPGSAPPTDISSNLTGMAEGATYHFRIVAENDAGGVEGPDQVVITLQRGSAEACANTPYRTGLSANLPDCRAYELVTPAETNGLTPYAAGAGSFGAGFNNWLVDPRGLRAGESLAYFTNGTLPGFDGNGRNDGYRALRGSDPHPASGWESELVAPSYAETGGDEPDQQGVASDQLYSFWQINPLTTFEGTLANGIYLRTPAGFELLGRGSLTTDPEVESRFVSHGGTHAIFTSSLQLEPQAPATGTRAIYDRVAGASTASVVSLKSDGSPFASGESASFVATSDDGAATVFRVEETLYVRREGETTEVAAPSNIFAGISEDGERVFYAVAGDLFVCDVAEGPCAGPGAHAPTEIAANSVFVNVSPGGSGVLLSSKAILPGTEPNEHGETAQAGKPNLYWWNGAATRFVAVLAEQDFESTAFGGIDKMNLGAWTKAINPGKDTGRAFSPTRATPGGEAFVFQSHARLTAYDNEGRGEIYRYDSTAPIGEQLLCVSCDPSGAVPSADAMLQNTFAGSGTNADTLIANLTDDGSEVFFQSVDRLLPEDANGATDVYEWKAQGTGTCTRDGGCLALLSSGQGEGASSLYGMSADGHDVFFRTNEKLVGADVPGSSSIYDARVEGGIPDPPPPAPCQGDACQGAGFAPPVLAPPASTGGGDEAPRSSKPCRKGKHRVKGRCVKKHRRHRKHQRANNSGRASR